MKKTILMAWLLMAATMLHGQTVSSPNGQISLNFSLTSEGAPQYTVLYKDTEVLQPSKLGFTIKDKPNFDNGFKIANSATRTENNTWEPVYGEVKTITNHFNELKITLSQEKAKERIFHIVFRVFDDGVGFRYEFISGKNLKYFSITDELTTFNLSDDHKAFWIPGDYDTNEYAYNTSKLSEINALNEKSGAAIAVKTTIAPSMVQTPLMLKSADGLYLNIHEAALINFPAMQLEVDQEDFSLKSHLVPAPTGVKAFVQAPFNTPWRTILISDQAEEILASKLILNLNPACEYNTTDWIKPQKFMGIWWEMHVGVGSWNYGNIDNVQLDNMDWSTVKPNGYHAANTENTKRYIDFCAAHGIDGLLIEGWNVGWEDWFGNWKEYVFDFVTPYPDFDIEELSAYAKEKGVKIIMHHETSGSATNYEWHLDTAYHVMKKHGYEAVKTGYVGKIIPRGEYHDGQWMVNHYNRVAKKAAGHEIMIDAHEPVRPTGLHRTYPNWMTSEAGRGNEYNGWSAGNPPEHETILPFTRMIGGPMDYTPGIFQIKLDHWGARKTEQIHTTLTKQLALYVTIYSPLQMVADLPQAYEQHLDAFQFIEDVAVDWDDTKIITAEPGDYLITARKAKNSEEWYLGAITDEQARKFTVKTEFLNAGKKYVAMIYQDSKDAHWDKNPMSYEIKKYIVDAKTKLKINLVESGGTAISFKPATKEETKNIKKYKE